MPVTNARLFCSWLVCIVLHNYRTNKTPKKGWLFRSLYRTTLIEIIGACKPKVHFLIRLGLKTGSHDPNMGGLDIVFQISKSEIQGCNTQLVALSILFLFIK